MGDHFKDWQDSLKPALNDKAWDEHDHDVQIAVSQINSFLKNSPGYTPLDWHVIKAMLWVETGARNKQWEKKPMQIGVSTDPGMGALLDRTGAGPLVTPPAWVARLTPANIRSHPADNIRAGVAFLVMRLSISDEADVEDKTAPIRTVKARHGDSFDAIAWREHSRSSTIQHLNPAIKPSGLMPGQMLKVRSATRKRVITGWVAPTVPQIARQYNAGGDLNYAAKLAYALELVRKKASGKR